MVHPCRCVTRTLHRVPALLVLATAALGASAAPSALQMLRDTVVDTPAQGLPYVELLQQAGDASGAELLRLGLLTAHIAALDTGATPTPVQLGATINRAVGQLAPGPGSPVALQWARVFNRQMALQWAPLSGDWPPDLSYLQPQLQALGPGAWWMNSSGQVRYLASIKLLNRSPTPLPLREFGLRIGQGGQALDMTCRPPADAAAAQRGVLATDTPVPLPAGRYRAFICRAESTAAWKDVVARLARGTPAPGDSATLLPQHFQQPQGVVMLAQAIASAHPVDQKAWARRLAADPASVAGPAMPLATNSGLAAARAVNVVSAASEASAASTASAAKSRSWRSQIHDRIQAQRPWGIASMAVLLLFAAGRLLVAIGLPRLAVYVTTVLLLAAVGVTIAVSAWAQSSGGGYWGWVGDLFGVVWLLSPLVVVGTVVLALHSVADMLASEGLSWPASVARALRRTLDYGGSAGRGEFWGYVGFCMLAWVTCIALYPPASAPLGLLLGLPMLSLAWRRVNGMSTSERRALVHDLADSLRKLVSRR